MSERWERTLIGVGLVAFVSASWVFGRWMFVGYCHAWEWAFGM
jgi:hypothetical protein